MKGRDPRGEDLKAEPSDTSMTNQRTSWRHCIMHSISRRWEQLCDSHCFRVDDYCRMQCSWARIPLKSLPLFTYWIWEWKDMIVLEMLDSLSWPYSARVINLIHRIWHPQISVYADMLRDGCRLSCWRGRRSSQCNQYHCGRTWKMTMQVVFLEWMECLRQCSDTNGDYIDESNEKILASQIVLSSPRGVHKAVETTSETYLECFGISRE
jgi:hypothetical protein